MSDNESYDTRGNANALNNMVSRRKIMDWINNGILGTNVESFHADNEMLQIYNEANENYENVHAKINQVSSHTNLNINPEI